MTHTYRPVSQSHITEYICVCSHIYSNVGHDSFHMTWLIRTGRSPRVKLRNIVWVCSHIYIVMCGTWLIWCDMTHLYRPVSRGHVMEYMCVCACTYSNVGRGSFGVTWLICTGRSPGGCHDIEYMCVCACTNSNVGHDSFYVTWLTCTSRSPGVTL